MNIEINAKVGALFQLKTHKGNPCQPTSETPLFHNLVLNTGLDRMSVGSWFVRVCVGSGNSTPVVTQTQLDSFVASTTTVVGTEGKGIVTTSPMYYWARRTYRFNPPGTNENLSEIGLGWTSTNLHNRALIKDNLGNPTTITWLSDEYLDVLVEERVYVQESISGSFNLLDKFNNVLSTHTYTGKPYLNTNNIGLGNNGAITCQHINIYSGDMGATVTNLPSSLLSTSDSTSNSYPTARSNTGLFSLNLSTAISAPHKSFNVPIVGLLTSAFNSTGYQFQISPTITKTNAQTMQYSVTVSWGRYTP